MAQIEHPTDANLIKGRRFALWNVGAAFLAFFFLMGMPTLLMPTLYPMIMQETGWTRGEVTAFASFKFLAGALSAFFIGFLIDWIGITRTTILTAVLTGIGLAAFFWIDGLFFYYLVGFVLGVGSISTSITIKVLISNWYSARQGTMIGIAMLGAGFAGILTPPVAQALSEVYGWRLAAILMSIGIWVLFIPIYLLAARGTPEELGLNADTLDPGKKKTSPPDFDAQPVFSEILRERVFWLLMIGNFLIGFVEQGINQNTKIFLENEVMLSGALAALALSLISFFGNVGKVAFGWVFDRFSVRGVAFCWIAIGIGVLTAFPVGGIFTLVLFTLVRGTSHAGILIDIPVLAKHCFGVRTLAKVVSILYAGYMLGAASGSSGVGFMADYFGSYLIPFVIISIMAFVAALMIWNIKPRYWSR